MNFLLYMLGRARRCTNLRPQGRESLIGTAAVHGAQGKFAEALAAYQKLTGLPGTSAVDMLIRGQLHLLVNEKNEARDCFARGMGRLLESRGAGQEQTQTERLVADAELLLSCGRYDAAIRALRQARAMIDLLLAAEAGLVLSQNDWNGAFTTLVRFSDITMRMLSRAELSRQLAGSLRRRCLSDKLASWATSGKNVDNLLNREFARLSKLAARTPAHAEASYRLALVASALGCGKEAITAFDHVLSLHPHHVSSAVRLATLLRGTSRAAEGKSILQRALFVPAATMKLFADLSTAAVEAQFDASASHFSETCGSTTPRANLALALSELGMLDESREAWREPDIACLHK